MEAHFWGLSSNTSLANTRDGVLVKSGYHYNLCPKITEILIYFFIIFKNQSYMLSENMCQVIGEESNLVLNYVK